MIKFCERIGVLILFFMPLAVLAQPPVPVVEYTVHYGDYGDGEDLTGYVTYDVYLEFSALNPNPKLTTIYSAVPDLGPQYILTVDAPCGLFQHDQGGPSVEDVACFILPFFPSIEFDSFFTIGNACKANADQPLFTVTTDQPAIAAWENTVVPGNYFDGGASMTLNNTAFFRLPSDPLTNPDASNRVLIGRFTTCGDICLNYAIQYFPDYTGPGGNFETEIQNACFDHPCLNNPFDTTPTVGSAGCFGDATAVTLSDGGFEEVTYTLFSGTTVGQGTLADTFINQNSGLTINGIADGDYYITMEDAAGCRDTTAVFEVTEPQLLEVSATLLTNNLCFGANIASIEVLCSGGTGQLSLTVNGGPATCGTTLTNLACGSYVFLLEDENGCTDTQTIQVACPAAIQTALTSTSIPCFGYDDGTITGTITGGTGLITAELLLGGGSIDTATGTGTVNVNFDQLIPGTYTLEYTDANGCGASQDFTITEPAEFSTVSVSTDALCFDQCNGTLVFELTGGTAPFNTEVILNGGGVSNPNALCAGIYTWTITDDNGCEISDTAIIAEPGDITSTVTPISETCNGICDGQIVLANTTGGFGGYTYVLSPNTGLCTAPCTGPNAAFTNLCSGNYSVTIEDTDGCSKTLTGISITSPTAIVVNLNPDNVSCFGLGDGSVVVTASGGTGILTLSPGGEALPFTDTDLVPGTYSYEVSDENDCVASADVIITEPSVLLATLTSTTNVSCGGSCNGVAQYTVVGGTNPYSYLLLPNGTTGAVNGVIGSLCAEDYELVVIDINGCDDTLEFTINEPPALFIDVLLDAPTCTGMTDGSALIFVGGGTGELTTVFNPDDYEITQVSPDSWSIANLGETSFVVDVFDENDCTLQETVVVVPDLITDMVISSFSSPETCWDQMDGSATIAVQNGNPPLTYEWNDSQEQTTPVATGLASNETYSVTVTDVIGCNLTVEVFVDPTVGCFFISTGLTPNGDGSNDEWLLGGLEYFPDAKVQVFNRWGQVVFESTGYGSAWNGTYEGVLLPVADYYFLIDYSDEFDPIMGTVTIKY